MSKKAKLISVEAAIVEIVYCVHNEGIHRDFKKEHRAYADAVVEERTSSVMGSLQFYELYYDKLYEYKDKNKDSYIEWNRSIGSPKLYNYLEWYDVKIKIKYQVKGIDYYKTVEIESETEMSPDETLFVTCYEDNPEDMQSISNYNEKDLFRQQLCVYAFILLPLIIYCLWVFLAYAMKLC